MLTCDCLDEQAVKVDIDVRAMRREVAMREGEARRFATSRAGRCNRAPLHPFGRACIYALLTTVSKDSGKYSSCEDLELFVS